MNLEQWKKAHGDLSEYYKRFANHYPIYEKGKNKKVRSDAEREMRAAMHGATHFLRNNPEISDLLTSDTTKHGRIYAFDEFKDPRFFRQDLPSILNKIEEIIKNLEKDTRI